MTEKKISNNLKIGAEGFAEQCPRVRQNLRTEILNLHSNRRQARGLIMNRLFAYAIIVNVVLLVGFVLVDYVTLNSVATNLGHFLEGFPGTNSTEQITGIHSYYGIIQVGITAAITIPYTFMTIDVSGIAINLPLIWFILTIITNLYMSWHFGMKKIADVTQSQKAESGPEHKTN